MTFYLFRFNKVQFEIASTDDVGVFAVSARFMGVSMEKVELVFQVNYLKTLDQKEFRYLFGHKVSLKRYDSIYFVENENLIPMKNTVCPVDIKYLIIVSL